MSGTVCVDTSALLALANPRDQYHAAAVVAARKHLAAGGRFIGSVLVLGELHGHLLQRRGPAPARTVLDALLHDPAYAWEWVSPKLIADAITNWLERFGDQRFSLTDAVSFTLMRSHRVTVAFAYDQDFRTAGFALMG
jgi:predicted nucleic acid-binding protein